MTSLFSPLCYESANVDVHAGVCVCVCLGGGAGAGVRRSLRRRLRLFLLFPLWCLAPFLCFYFPPPSKLFGCLSCGVAPLSSTKPTRAMTVIFPFRRMTPSYIPLSREMYILPRVNVRTCLRVCSTLLPFSPWMSSNTHSLICGNRAVIRKRGIRGVDGAGAGATEKKT